MHPMKDLPANQLFPMNIRSDLSERVAYVNPGFLFYVNHGELSQFPDYSALCHWHEDIELIYIKEGGMDYHVNGKVVHLRKNEGIFVNSRQLHYGFSKEHEDCKFYCVLIHPMMLCASSYVEEHFILPVTRRGDVPYVQLRADVDWQAEINRLICEIFALKETDKPQMQMLAHGFCLWDLLCRHLPPAEEETPQQLGDLMLIRSMMQYIDRNYAEKLTMNGIAAAGHVSVSKCYNLFHVYLGQTPLEYVTRFRLEKSIELMKAGGMKITEVALQVGFSGASYFAETFRKYYGCSPSDYLAG